MGLVDAAETPVLMVFPQLNHRIWTSDMRNVSDPVLPLRLPCETVSLLSLNLFLGVKGEGMRLTQAEDQMRVEGLSGC